MSVSIPPAGLQLHGIAARNHDPKHSSNSAILFKLSPDLLEDVKKSSQSGFQFVTGNTPQIRLGKRTIDLTISPEAFRHELYAASTENLGDLDLAAVVSHRAELKVPERKQSVGSDAALAALQSSLASYQQEKQAKSVNISDRVIREPKNRWEAAKEQKQAYRRGLLGSQPANPSLGASSTSTRGAAPTSMPTGDSAARNNAMRTALTHLMAMRSLSREEMLQKTHIPKDDLDEVLQKVGKPDQGKWQLSDRAYKELDVWKFGYSTKEDRQAAIDNAIRAFDRMRLGKDEKIWQMLLPREDRDKGIVLSKLHLGNGAANKSLTPNLASSPMVQGDGTGDSKMASATNSPRLGPASTPKVGAKNDAYTKRLFSKDPKKARAAEEAKEKKRKEREVAAAASDKEGGKPARKKQTTKNNNPKALSAEMVEDSSDEDEGEVKEKAPASAPSSQPKSAAGDRKPAPNAATKPRAKPAKPAGWATSNGSEAVAKPTKAKTAAAATPKAASTPKTGTPSTASKSNPQSSKSAKASKPAPLGKSTPNGLSAPSSQHRSQLSPKKADSRPTVPSPLGAARPRVASDVSDRGAVGVQRVKHGAETPKGLGITNGFRKRQDTVTSSDSHSASHHPDKMNGDRPRKNLVGSTNGTPKPSQVNGVGHKNNEDGLKRKAVDSPAQLRENGVTAKHRKTESSSSQSRKSHSSEDARLERTASSDSASSIINDITYSQGVNIAQKFRDVYYPQYAKLYDEQAAMEKRGETVPREDRQRLWDMHRRLEQMKREIRAASAREHMEEQ
ncbi:Hypothetical predicted protein [Lecanosticta acicola]|uniref:Uncharacterized protein n=1 Tax=Lecanosticta acicola TaxID=111012 RepID=A0AAI8YWE3_9PEZI|nr:Hypothetical predicted protein [Lecanosticta acicola]